MLVLYVLEFALVNLSLLFKVFKSTAGASMIPQEAKKRVYRTSRERQGASTEVSLGKNDRAKLMTDEDNCQSASLAPRKPEDKERASLEGVQKMLLL
jgi:hypothetical protein